MGWTLQTNRISPAKRCLRRRDRSVRADYNRLQYSLLGNPKWEHYRWGLKPNFAEHVQPPRKKVLHVMGVHVTEISRPRPNFRAVNPGEIAAGSELASSPNRIPNPPFSGADPHAWITRPLRLAGSAELTTPIELEQFEADRLPVELPSGLSETDADYRSKALLDFIATPAAICDSAGAILRSNALMDSILLTQDGLFLQQGCLKCVVGTESTLLLRTIQSLAGGSRSAGERKSQFLRISRSFNSQPLIVVVSPLCAGTTDRNLAEALVRIVATAHRREIDVNSLCEAFDLTKSEATLSVALAQCGSLKDAAAMCGITTGSARQYMKRIFTKTNTSSQVALLSLLLHYPIL